MAEERVQRRLAAILAADVVGYSRLMQTDEEGTLRRLKVLRSDVIDCRVAEYGGRIFKTTGDGVYVEFPSAVDAVRHAVDVQRHLAQLNADVPEGDRIALRIGISLGDVMVDGGDLFGNGVNVAARMEGLAEPGGVCVSGNVHEQVRGTAGLIFVDIGEQRIKNIDRPVHSYRVVVDGEKAASAAAIKKASQFQQPAVAVLPFDNLSGDPEHEYFADGLTEDIITALSLWKSFPVIDRNSTFAYKGTAHDIRKIGEELGARYVVEGSVRKGGDRVRVTAQLIDAENGHHVWADRYDRELRDIFAVQDVLTECIAGIVAPTLEVAEHRRSMMKQPTNFSAWDCYLRGMAEFYRYTKEGNERARSMFERALKLDSTFAKAHAAIALSHFADIRLAHSASPTASADAGYTHARRAVELDANEPIAHHVLGIALLVSREFARCVDALRTAYSLNPNDATIVNSLGYALVLSGIPDEGVLALERGFRLSPRDPRNPAYFSFMARGRFSLGQYEATVEWAQRALSLRENTPEAYLLLAAAFGHIGRSEKARLALAKCEALVPGFSRPENWPHTYARESDTQHLIDGLRKAGLPE